MIEWRDRGEVLDSDDEDLSISIESRDPVQSGKDTTVTSVRWNGKDDEVAASVVIQGRTVGQPDQAKETTTPLVDQDDELQNGQVEITCVAAPGSQDGGQHASENHAGGRASLEHQLSVARAGKKTDQRTISDNDTDESDVDFGSWKGPAGVNRTITYGKKLRTSRRTPIESDRDVSGARQPSTSPTAEIQCATALDIDTEVQPPISSDSESLPDIDRTIRTGELLTNAYESADLDTFDVPSSPLSEREVSPPPHLMFIGGEDRANRTTFEKDAVTKQSGRDEGHRKFVQVGKGVGEGLRRSTRTRRAIQVNPFVLERVLYLKDCKERGIRPIPDPELDRRIRGAIQTQDLGYENGSDSHSNTGSRSSSPAQVPSPAHRTPIADVASSDAAPIANASEDEDEFPDIDAILHRVIPGAAQNGRKRRKTSHLETLNNTGDYSGWQPQEVDDFTVPPSPPSTSSHSPGPINDPSTAIFRLPRRVSPAPFPTPDVSSAREASSDLNIDILPDVNSPPFTARKSAISRHRGRVVEFETSSDSSSAESEIEQRQLVREQKRVKGVLPASWLKLDQQARRVYPSSNHNPDSNTLSPHRTLPQKGVAQRITSRPTGMPRAPSLVEISDGSEESNASTDPPPAFQLHQTRLRFHPASPGVASGELVDDERMEIDWVDPMFAGSSRKKAPQSNGKKIQPRIREAFEQAKSDHADISEEPGDHRRPDTINHSSRSKQKVKSSHRPRARQRRAPSLSILDAPESPNSVAQSMPQFIRLAARRARGLRNRARHSPTSKIIRLATEEDTEDASTTLRAWRAGTLIPTERLRPAKTQQTSTLPDVEPVSSMQNTPLRAISGNQQHRLPTSSTKETPVGMKKRQVRIRRPRMLQTVLQPLNIDSTSPHMSGHPLDTPASHQQRKKHQKHPSVQPARLREAQLETLENAFDGEHRKAAFERRMREMTQRLPQQMPFPQTDSLQVSRFRQDAETFDRQSDTEPPVAQSVSKQPSHRDQGSRATITYRRRKKKPHRLDAESRQYRQPSEPIPILDETGQDGIMADPGDNVLRGLGPFGTKYATDFDVRPLELGTYFHESTLIGSGQFRDSLSLSERNMDVTTGRISIHVNDEVLHWSVWDDNVASGLPLVMQLIREQVQTLIQSAGVHQSAADTFGVQGNIEYLLRSVIQYCSKCLSFLDPIDRQSCAVRLQRFVNELLHIHQSHSFSGRHAHDLHLPCLVYGLVLAYQTLQICDHSHVQPETRTQSRDQVKEAGRSLGRALFPQHLDEIRQFFESNRRHAVREAGIRDDETAVMCTVVLYHVLSKDEGSPVSFWQTFNDNICDNPEKLCTVAALDQVWYNILTILPLLEIDTCGLAHVGTRLNKPTDNWMFLKRPLERLFALYPETSMKHSSTANDYIRATLTRCHRLITRWGWWRSEVMLNTIFDFFARRGLSQVHKEESRESPRFLEDLSKDPSLEIQAEDRSFHIFLKTLAVGLKGMRSRNIYTDKRIGGIAYRFVPNHGRTHRNDAEVKQSDLDALRNHHDLLCTLYFACPPAQRPRLELIRNLVDHKSSHREACRLSIRAWANLAAFQLSTNEPTASVEPFANWYHEIIETTISQYRLARVEAEEQFAIAKARGVTGVTQDMLDNTIASNQRQIIATLVDALAAMKRAITTTRNWQVTTTLVELSRFWQVFDLFDPAHIQICAMVHEAVEVITSVLTVYERFRPQTESQPESEESQDYGDSGLLQEFISAGGAGAASTDWYCMRKLHESLAHLVSNAFGAERAPDDAFLVRLTDVWLSMTKAVVERGEQEWTNHMDGFSTTSWFQLRDTEQRRKFTGLFLSRMIDIDSRAWSQNRSAIVSTWLLSLVEREAMLKYQHVLTASLLNTCPDEPLVQNLPFSKDARAHRYDITPQQFRQRRLALISSVLANMFDNFETSMRDMDVLRTYSEMLRQLMNVMKRHYQELQSRQPVPEEIADPSTQGAYVAFIHQVVSFLQQYTTEICPVDKFFTDSAAFPLPATDPKYVVGKLKGYTAKLHDAKTRKQLATFVHTMCERAVVDGQQHYMVAQLSSAMSGTYERGDIRAPTLRYVLIAAILPAYIETALSSACTWVITLPVLQALELAFGDLIYDFRVTDSRSAEGIISMISAVLCSLMQPFNQVLSHPGLLELPHTQRVLAAAFLTVGASLTVVDYIERSGVVVGCVLLRLAFFKSCSAYFQDFLHDPFETVAPETQQSMPNLISDWQDTKDFSKRQIDKSMTEEWSARDGQYFVRRANTWREVLVDLDGQEREALLAAIDHFSGGYESVIDRRGKRPPMVGKCNANESLIV